jgi:hypothetical protein
MYIIDKCNKSVESYVVQLPDIESGISYIALKKLPREAHLIMMDIIHHYWNGINNNPEWNQALLFILYNKTGKQEDLHNY